MKMKNDEKRGTPPDLSVRSLESALEKMKELVDNQEQKLAIKPTHIIGWKK